MNKQPEITDATRDAFIDAFCALALTKPVGSITIREITESAGYNRTTFYRYFSDVYALLNYLEDRLIEDFLKSVNEKQAPFVFNDEFFKNILEFMQKNKTRMLVVFSENNRGGFIAKLQKWITQNMGMENSAHNAMAMTIYFSGLTAALTAWLKGAAVDEEDLTSMMGRLFSEWYLPEITKKSDN